MILAMSKDIRVILVKAGGSSAQDAHNSTPARGQAHFDRAGDAGHLCAVAHRLESLDQGRSWRILVSVTSTRRRTRS